MDVIIPAHNLRILSSSLTTLAKIGKQLYIEFDPLTGLTLRTLNDGKSCFGEFAFDVGFFERCTSPPGSKLKKRVKVKSSSSGGNGNARSSSTTNAASTSGTARRRKRNQREMSTSASHRTQETEGDDDDHDHDHDHDFEDLDEKYLCRVPIRTVAAILHSRKGLQSLRIRSIGSHSANSHANTNANTNINAHNRTTSSQDEMSNGDDDDESPRMQLSFEFRIQSSGIMKITHKISVSNAESVIASASRTNCSEIVASPRLLLKMMDPVQSPEIALVVNDQKGKVTATSFHYADASLSVDGRGGGNGNLILSASADKVLKTETSVDCEEFDEFIYSDGKSISNANTLSNANANADDDSEEEACGQENLPEGIEHEVSLVFSSKEAKAMLQFCTNQAGGNADELGEMKVIVNFHWGGRPIVFETEGDAFKGQVILSTVSHLLLKGVDLTSRGQKKKNKQRSSSTGMR